MSLCLPIESMYDVYHIPSTFVSYQYWVDLITIKRFVWFALCIHNIHIHICTGCDTRWSPMTCDRSLMKHTPIGWRDYETYTDWVTWWWNIHGLGDAMTPWMFRFVFPHICTTMIPMLFPVVYKYNYGTSPQHNSIITYSVKSLKIAFAH
jgi:hypothetical protein